MTKEERNELVMENIKLVHMVAKRYSYRAKLHSLDYDDLVSEGTIGLIKAVENFDPSFGCVLSTYAVPKIAGAMQVLLRDYHYGPKFSRNIIELRNRIVHACLEDEQFERVADEFGASLREVVAAMDMIKHPYSFDIDVPNSIDDERNHDFYEMVSDGTDFAEEVVLECFVDTLPERDRFIFVNTLEDRTQAEIGHALGISQVQVSRLLRRIRTSMSEYLGRNVG